MAPRSPIALNLVLHLLVSPALLLAAAPAMSLGLNDLHRFTADRLISEDSRPAADENWLAIVGDSSVTGAAAHHAYSARFISLLDHAANFLLESQRTELVPHIEDYPSPAEFGLSEPIAPITRIMFSAAEWATKCKWSWKPKHQSG